MKRWVVLLAAFAFLASGCDLKDAKSSGRPAPATASADPSAGGFRSLKGAAGQLARGAQSSSSDGPVSDQGRVLFDGARTFQGGAAVVPAAYFNYGARPAVQYTSLTSSIPSDLALAPPPSPADARDISRYASLRSALIRGGAEARVVDESIRQAVAKGMDPLMILAIGMQESNLHSGARSSVGARGAMQLMPGTACGLGVCNAAALYNPTVNVALGTTYFKGLWDRFVGSDMLSTNPLSPFVIHRVSSAIAAYNAGPGAVIKYGGVPPYQETANYVRKVVAYYERFRRYQGSVISA